MSDDLDELFSRPMGGYRNRWDRWLTGEALTFWERLIARIEQTGQAPNVAAVCRRLRHLEVEVSQTAVRRLIHEAVDGTYERPE